MELKLPTLLDKPIRIQLHHSFLHQEQVLESTSGNVSSSGDTYANIDGTNAMLDGGVPITNTGVGGAYALGDLGIV